MDIEPIYCAEQIVVSPDLADVLKAYTKEVIRRQPQNLIEFSANQCARSTRPIQGAATGVPQASWGHSKGLFFVFGSTLASDRFQLLISYLAPDMDPDITSQWLMDLSSQLAAMATVTYESAAALPIVQTKL
ncbi:RIIa domain-containing protein, partial [Haematococcus lacustris]